MVTVKINNGSGVTVSINAPGKDGNVTINNSEPLPINYTKNIRLVDDVSTYDAFGHMQRTGEDRITYYYRSGSTHILGGVIRGRHYTISTDTWGEAFEIYADPEGLDMRDCWGGRMSNGESVLFSCASEYVGTPETLKSHAIMLKGDGETFGEPVSLFNGAVPEMQRGLPFGGMIAGQTPGTYYIAMWQFNSSAGTVDKPTFPLYRIDVLKTTDYWETWTCLNVYEGATAYSESALVVYPDETKMSMFIRRDPAGMLWRYESTNSGASWTSRAGVDNLGLNGSKPKQPFVYVNSGGLMDIIVSDRSDGWIRISRNVPWENFAGINAAEIGTDELYAWDRIGGLLTADNFKLGYPSIMEIEDGKYIIMFAKQELTNKANIYYTLDDFTTDDGLPITPPALDVYSVITDTTALVYTRMDDEEGGYTLEQLENIRWTEWDLSTDNFSTFVTARVKGVAGASYSFSGEIHEFRLTGTQLNLYELTPATTYQIRCRAVNLNGTSNWTETEFTTD